MDKDKILKDASHVEFHDHHAPVYNISIGYVDKQINGDYYEFHHADGSIAEVEKVKEKKSVGPKKKYLFIKDGNEHIEDSAVMRREKDKFMKYLSKHNLSSRPLTSAKDDTLTSVFVCFWKCWCDNNLVASSPTGPAIFRFLTEECSLKTEVTQKAFSNVVVSVLKAGSFSVQTYRDVSAYLKKK